MSSDLQGQGQGQCRPSEKNSQKETHKVRFGDDEGHLTRNNNSHPLLVRRWNFRKIQHL